MEINGPLMIDHSGQWSRALMIDHRARLHNENNGNRDTYPLMIDLRGFASMADL